MNLDPLLKMLWKTPEGIANLKAIAWCDAHFPEMSVAKCQDYCDKFEKKYDEPLNKRWAEILKLYNIKVVKTTQEVTQ